MTSPLAYQIWNKIGYEHFLAVMHVMYVVYVVYACLYVCLYLCVRASQAGPDSPESDTTGETSEPEVDS